ncbi:MAG: hypothetical protein EA377_09315 [Phycisphaerales bacterium]|nr:MAG: hypothetical protein EA377_09315 [Phycisphaerales bacterium]
MADSTADAPPTSAEILATTHPACTRCGYDLHGLTPDAKCPECATQVAYSLAYPTKVESDSERLKSSHPPCLRCGYDLHGLTPDADCPECGAPVQRSLRGNLLRFSAPEYLRSLSTGLLLILVAVVSQVAITIINTIGMMVLLLAFQNPVAVGVLENIIAICYFGIIIMSFIGWWMFSTPDPAIVGQDQGDSPRKILRITIVAALILTLISTVAELFFITALNLMWLGFVAGGLILVAWLVQFFASLLYVQWIAKRVPSQKIRQRAEIYMWLLPLICVVGLCVIFIGPIIAMVMYFVLLYQLYGMIRDIHLKQAEDESIMPDDQAQFA